MDADIQIMVETVQTDWYSWQVCDSVIIGGMLLWCHLDTVFSKVSSNTLSFHSAAFECQTSFIKAELVLEQVLGTEVNSVGGAKVHQGGACFSFLCASRQKFWHRQWIARHVRSKTCFHLHCMLHACY